MGVVAKTLMTLTARTPLLTEGYMKIMLGGSLVAAEWRGHDLKMRRVTTDIINN
jgi:hypothetical protein